MSTAIKFRLKRMEGVGGDLRELLDVTVFCGIEGQTLQNAGVLKLKVGEYQLMAVALVAFADAHADHLKFIVEGEKEALKEAAK